MTFYDLVQKVVIKNKEKVFLICDEKKYTYEMLLDDINTVKDKLIDRNIINRKIGIVNSNIYLQIIYFIGILESKNIPILINIEIPKDTIELLKEKDNLIILKNNLDISSREIDDFKFEGFGVLSSGTTGLPKIIFRSEESWIKGFDYQSQIFNLNKNSIGFIHGSLSFSANLNYLIHFIYLGATVISSEKKMVKNWIYIIEKEKVNSIFLVPSKYKIILRRNNIILSNIKSVISAGEKLDMSIIKDMREMFCKGKIVEYYGCSETSFISYNIFKDEVNYTRGIIFPEVTVKNEGHNLYVNSPYLAQGYNAYYKVNDKGYIQDNKLILIGRYDNVINRSGVKVNLKNIESKLNKLNYLDQYVVFSKKDVIHGEEVCAALVLKDKKVTKIKIIRDLRINLSKYEIPKIIILDSIPLNINGKIDIINLKNIEEKNIN
ncbi:Plipastatin synthase subunit B [uncultured Clostridium sp.]|uniref:AMP-binding protein n=1 Tax=uncultured Clostridium sp. TaxID=59620 RepID=UPI0008226376|nr:AMP-binding protein [uncultured Clostridium sp.]SCJ97501.1 Plipastatin synthase subunit B [uncultured Clostridium sp.]